MELGQRIKAARLEKGLSQRQLCGDMITRNMLSLIENSSARPSMDTLSYLARQLEKPISYFLQEDAVTSPNHGVMTQIREAYRRRDYLLAKELLAAYRGPDETFDAEKELLQATVYLSLAQQAIIENRIPYAIRLLEDTEALQQVYCAEELEQKRQLLLAQTGADTPLPDVDAVLILKARRALRQGQYDKAGACLDACENHTALWQLLQGEVFLNLQDYRQAVIYLSKAEEQYPELVAPMLERCYSALEDYKMAYFYACKQKK